MTVKGLTEVWLQDNQLTSLPSDVGDWRALILFYAFANDFAEVYAFAVWPITFLFFLVFREVLFSPLPPPPFVFPLYFLAFGSCPNRRRGGKP